MIVRARILSYLIDALVNIQQPLRDRFTMTMWLMVQLLPGSWLGQLANNEGSGETPAEANDDLLLQIKAEFEEIVQTLEACLETTPGDPACFEAAAESLLQIVENYALELLVPADWQAEWMGVEG